MKILAIDPGYERVGIAILDDESGKEVLLYSDCILTARTDDFTERLHCIGVKVEDLIKTYTPDTMAIENLFFNTNQKTAMHVAEVRGALIFLAKNAHMRVVEYTPLQVKTAISGYGRGKKEHLVKILRQLISIEKDVACDDEYDAISIGLTCFVYQKSLFEKTRRMLPKTP